jgi:hypothetical protein
MRRPPSPAQISSVRPTLTSARSRCAGVMFTPKRTSKVSSIDNERRRLELDRRPEPAPRRQGTRGGLWRGPYRGRARPPRVHCGVHRLQHRDGRPDVPPDLGGPRRRRSGRERRRPRPSLSHRKLRAGDRAGRAPWRVDVWSGSCAATGRQPESPEGSTGEVTKPAIRIRSRSPRTSLCAASRISPTPSTRSTRTASLRSDHSRRLGGVVTQRPAKPFTPVRFR